MKPQFFSLPLIAVGALAACQVTTAPQQSQGDADDAANPSRYSTPENQPSTGYAPAPASSRSTGSSSYGTTAAASEPSRYQDPPLALHDTDRWGPGTWHIGFGGSFVNDETEDEEGTDPGDDIETMDVDAEVGTLLTDRVEINAQAAYHESDIGEDDVNRVAVLGGLRYYLVTPTDVQNVGVYAEGKAGVMSVDSPDHDESEFAYGASAGFLWFPWGADDGLAFDISADWLQSDTIDRIGASAGLSYYW